MSSEQETKFAIHQAAREGRGTIFLSSQALGEVFMLTIYFSFGSRISAQCELQLGRAVLRASHSIIGQPSSGNAEGR